MERKDMQVGKCYVDDGEGNNVIPCTLAEGGIIVEWGFVPFVTATSSDGNGKGYGAVIRALAGYEWDYIGTVRMFNTFGSGLRFV